MKFIHCADLHLASKQQTHLPREKAAARRTEILLTFKRLTEYAAANDITAVIIAGDLFDTRAVSEATVNYVLDAIKAAQNTDFLYLVGNHDAVPFSEDRLPDNLKLFSDIWTTYRYGNVTISGVRQTAVNLATLYDTLRLSPDDINVVTMHGAIDKSLSPRPISTEDVYLKFFEDSYIDYLALGHYHSYSVGNLSARGVYCYSGCLEGRGFDECGQKGFVLLDTDGGKLKSSFVPFASRLLHDIKVDISRCEDIYAIESAVKTALQDVDSNDIVKLTLCGSLADNTDNGLEHLRTSLNNRFFFARVTDETSLAISPDDYLNDLSLKGEFIRSVMSDKTLSDKEKNRVITCGINALRGKEFGL